MKSYESTKAKGSVYYGRLADMSLVMFCGCSCSTRNVTGALWPSSVEWSWIALSTTRCQTAVHSSASTSLPPENTSSKYSPTRYLQAI